MPTPPCATCETATVGDPQGHVDPVPTQANLADRVADGRMRVLRADATSGTGPRIAAHVAGIAPEETARLNALNDTESAGVLAVSDDLDPDRTEGSELWLPVEPG